MISLNDKTVLFLAIQFSISTQFSSIWLIDRALSGAVTGPGSNGNEVVLAFPNAPVLLEPHNQNF